MAYNVHYGAKSPERTSSPVFRSCQSLSGSSSPQSFYSPRTSPDPLQMHHANALETEAVATEITPLVGDENHFGTFEQTVDGSMSLTFPGSQSSAGELNANFSRKMRECCSKAKPYIFFVLALVLSVIFAWKPEVPDTPRFVIISNSTPEYISLGNLSSRVISIEISGPFPHEDDAYNPSDPNITIALTGGKNGKEIVGYSQRQNVPVLQNTSDGETTIPAVTRKFRLSCNESVKHVMLMLSSNTSFPVAVSVFCYLQPFEIDAQVIGAFVILLGVYILIIFELVHRAMAAMLGALGGLAFMSYNNMRPPMETILTWVEWETLSLLFGMMILVAIFAKTGFFDYVALKAYTVSRGHVWVLITLLCTCTAVISALLDNVTVILLLTPVTVRLCQVLNLNPTYVLIAEVLFSNIGGTATAIGDPPNVIIASNRDIDIDFAEFTAHLTVGIFFCFLTAYLTLRLLFWKVKLENDDPPVIEEMKREAEIWRRTAARVPQASAEEKVVKLLLLQKAMAMENTIRNMKRATSRQEAFQQNLQEMERKYVIKDRPLLLKSIVVIVLVVVMFFLQSFVEKIQMKVGWIAVLGAILLILLADINNIEDLLEQVEWTTLLFFAALFILMESLSELGLMEYLSNLTSDAIQMVDEKHQLCVAIVAVVWISALVSSFVDNIPFTTAMIPVVLELHKKDGLPKDPLVWALALGACLGGNGTLIGASANVVCAGLAEQYGYPISFNKFFKFGFPIMIVTTLTATVYLLIAHVAFRWHNT